MDKDCPPKWLDNIGKRYWRRIAPALTRDGILTVATADLLGTACAAYSTYRAAHKTLETEGRVITTSSGTVKVNPNVTIEKQAFEQLCRVFKELQVGKRPETEAAIDPEEFA